MSEKKITAGHAKVLIGLDEKQQQLIVNSIIGQKLSVREVESIIKNMKEDKAPLVTKKDTPSYDFKKLSEKFTQLGFKIKSSTNKITLEFSNKDEIEKLLHLLQK